MGLFKKIFGKKDTPITSYHDFWAWFKGNEKAFFKVVKQRGEVEKIFFDQLSPKLNELKAGFFFLTGMCDDHTAELVLTADGAIKNIVFVEELVAAAPTIPGWKFTALKRAMNIDKLGIRMGSSEFNAENLSFFANEQAAYPDEIDITIVHKDHLKDSSNVINGVYIFLDNYLGELEFITNVDNLVVAGPEDAPAELIPISKLKDYLNWRQKEFVEKYDGMLYDTENATYSMLEAALPNGNKLLAVINTDVLEWENKASHPWILSFEIEYEGQHTNGMPNTTTYQLLDEFENKLLDELHDFDGYLNIGRQTADNFRNIYFACKEFRKPSKVAYELQQQYTGKVSISYTIYKDKYWQTFDRYKN